VSISS